MKLTPTRIAGMAVTCAACAAVLLTQVAFAQEGQGDFAAGTSKLIGRQAIRPSDDRFAPAALAVVNASAGGSAGRAGRVMFSETIKKHKVDETTYFHQTIFRMGSRPGGGGGDV